MALHFALVAQLVEHRTFNPGVAGPIPAGRTKSQYGGMADAADSKSAEETREGSSPPAGTNLRRETMCNNNRKIGQKSRMEEEFDRISEENYERIDREVMSNIDRMAQYERKPRFFYAIFHILECLIVGALVGCTVAAILKLITT